MMMKSKLCYNDSEFVDVSKINAGTKKKDDYEARLESIKSGREARGKFGSKRGSDERTSITNKEKAKKTKAFMMIVHKRSVKGKATASLRDKQRSLRKHITKQKKKGM
jgi:protein SDA1